MVVEITNIRVHCSLSCSNSTRDIEDISGNIFKFTVTVLRPTQCACACRDEAAIAALSHRKLRVSSRYTRLYRTFNHRVTDRAAKGLKRANSIEFQLDGVGSNPNDTYFLKIFFFCTENFR